MFADSDVVGNLQPIVDSHKYGDMVQYVRGSVLIGADMERAKVEQASTLVVLANKSDECVHTTLRLAA